MSMSFHSMNFFSMFFFFLWDDWLPSNHGSRFTKLYMYNCTKRMMDAWINSEKIGRRETSLFGGGLRLNSERASVLETRFKRRQNWLGKISEIYFFIKQNLQKKASPVMRPISINNCCQSVKLAFIFYKKSNLLS